MDIFMTLQRSLISAFLFLILFNPGKEVSQHFPNQFDFNYRALLEMRYLHLDFELNGRMIVIMLSKLLLIAFFLST